MYDCYIIAGAPGLMGNYRRRVGKTTLASILAKSLNSENVIIDDECCRTRQMAVAIRGKTDAKLIIVAATVEAGRARLSEWQKNVGSCGLLQVIQVDSSTGFDQPYV